MHRADCSNLRNMVTRSGDRVIEVEWGGKTGGDGSVYPVDVAVEANDRQGLLRDISEVFAKSKPGAGDCGGPEWGADGASQVVKSALSPRGLWFCCYQIDNTAEVKSFPRTVAGRYFSRPYLCAWFVQAAGH